MRRTPVTLVTGFLGAGKTTLIRRVLDGADRRIAIVENELAELGIDQLLLGGGPGDVVELAGGCLCCSARSDLAGALDVLLAREPEHILIEASGIAAPGPIAETLIERGASRGDVRLHRVVCVVDALGEDARPEISAQLACADVVVITKADLAGPEAVARCREAIARLNPGAIVSDVGAADAELLLGSRGDRTESAVEPEAGDHLGLGHGVVSLVLEHGIVDEPAARRVLAAICAMAGVLRVKGVILTTSGAFAAQGVRERLDLAPLATRHPRSAIVIIGTNLAEDAISARWGSLSS